MSNQLFDPHAITPWNKKQTKLNVFIETPQGSRNKFAFDHKLGIIKLKSTLAQGMSFPFDFGFIPQTTGDDSDPLDILLLMDAPAFPGCLVKARLLGVIEGEECQGDETIRNDRLIAVWNKSTIYENIKGIADLNDKLLNQITDFLIFYKRAKGKEFKVLAIKDAVAANKLIENGVKKYKSKIDSV